MQYADINIVLGAEKMDESFLKLKGRKVMEENSGKCLGRLSDILVNKDTNKVIGVVAKNESLIYRHRFFKKEEIVNYDKVNLTVSGFGEKFLKIVPVFSDYKSCENDIFKRRAVFSDGSVAGKVQNINFDTEIGEICGLEIGTSIIQDLFTGRIICPCIQRIHYYQDRIVLEDVWKNEK